jgi:enamine deaminase RidA (YjgF/YER057c/UK114 family)
MSQQTREALKSLLQDNRGATIVKLRAFGTGDMRRVTQLVSEVFTERKLGLPTISTVQIGGLPLEGAQIVIESIALEKKVVNPNGLAFFSGQQTQDYRRSISQLQSAVKAAHVAPSGMLRATCFLSAMEDASGAHAALTSAFPGAALDVIQLQRLAVQPLAECEAVGRLDEPPSAAVVLVNPPDLQQNPNYSQIALVNAPKIVLTGTQLAFGVEDADVRLAFGRLRKALEPHGAGLKDVFWTSAYPLTRASLEKLRTVRWEFYDRARPSASTALLFEGLPSLDAALGLDVIALAK